MKLSIGLNIVTVLLATGSLKLGEIVIVRHNMPYWIDLLLLPMAFMFFISALAETNRHPFDLSEAELNYYIVYRYILFVINEKLFHEFVMTLDYLVL
ncbi:NADH-quinone oxidoreductase chain H [Ehrlichia ruminantium str. Welgevonden]|uniref:NADH-quinone oxidoreductase chain H n=1 Tax=Ehrlichia ruminantium (strain Welgevonden) TaxID=254945 RepID=A0A0H3M172_EHRRW|nr:NADH-quinone oxidoreductase chain H [Ehrlichia ruminantium str. Welgevonden]